nr:uncharacterized protein LOC112545614 [Pelodiscus sinensis]XP_025039896.1 uncharacterized protein LOC112545615 [Pelodiscus sinensis]|eukprot:XP_025039895.1 uncharacterized protein LOC112545614 [Pelodiscus sinensis]
MTLQMPQHFQHGTDPAAKQYQALRPPTATPGTVPAGCPCGAAGGRRSAWNGGISSPRSRHSSCTTFPPTSTLCAAASGAVRPVPIGGIASSWSGGMTSSGSRTSACRRTPFWSSANGSSLLSGDRTPGGDPPTPSRSRHHHTLEARHTGEATALWETSSECGEQPSGPCSCRKGCFSMVLQALVDHWSRFMDMYIRWSGKAHDTCSGTPASSRGFTPEVDMPMCIRGDAVYPLLMKPYTGHWTPRRRPPTPGSAGAASLWRVPSAT